MNTRLWKDAALLALAGIAISLWLFQPIRHANDIWWHLASARFMTQTMHWPRVDIFSSTAHGHAWIDHEWLYEVVLYGFFKLLGINGILVLKVLLIDLSLCLQWLRLKSRGVSFSLSIIGLGLMFWASRYGWNERADLVSVLGLSYTVWALDTGATEPKRIRLFLLPVVYALWANMHGGFVLGLIAMGIFLVDRLITHRSDMRATLGLFTACVLATLVNPYGITLWHSIAEGLLFLKSVTISEWQSTPWKHLELFWIILVLFCVLATRQAMKRRLSIWEAGLSLLLLWSAARYVRNVPYFMVGAFPLALVWLSEWKLDERVQKTIDCAVAGLSLVMIVLSFRSPVGGINVASLPVGACDFIQANLSTALFYNDYTFGSYWLWKLGPNELDFIDGRFHMIQGYPELFDEIRNAQGGSPADWNTFLNHHAADAVLIPYPSSADLGTPLRTYFPQEQWALLYWDDVGLVFIRRLPKYTSVIRQFEFRHFDPELSMRDAHISAEQSPSWAFEAREEITRSLRTTTQHERAVAFLAMLPIPSSNLDTRHP